MSESLGFSNTTNSAMTLFTVLANGGMGETLETFRTLCHTISIYSLPYVADGLLQLGNIICRHFGISAVTHGLYFATQCPFSHQQSPRSTWLCPHTFVFRNIALFSFEFQSLLFFFSFFPSHFPKLIFHAIRFPEAISLIYSSSGLPNYHITIFNTSAIGIQI